VRLFHFSDDPGITAFAPRPVRVRSERPPGREWLNGPLVWAIDDWHQPMYLFPRDCPRILAWPLASTTAEDLERYWTPPPGRMVAHIELNWAPRLKTGRIFRYELPAEPFESLRDAGMWVARERVEPLAVEQISDLPAALVEAGVTLRVVESLAPLKALWSSTLHFSGIRLRNAETWT
jgi:hypothetical protein